MALHTGENLIDGIPVEVVRRRAKHIRIRVRADGSVSLTVPFWRATLAQGAEFLASKWDWVVETRRRTLAHPAPVAREISLEEAEPSSTSSTSAMSWYFPFPSALYSLRGRCSPSK